MNVRVANGFTLVEVMVALAILAIALTTALGAVRSAAAVMDDLYDRSLSRWAARDAAARIRLMAADPAMTERTTITKMVYGRPYRIETIYIPDRKDDPTGPGTFHILASPPGAREGAPLGEASVNRYE